MTAARVTRLARYPVKACAPQLLTETVVGDDGLPHDRRLAVVVDGAVVTQREHAVLATVRPGVDGDDRLTLRHDGRPPTSGDLTDEGTTRTVTLFGRPVGVVDQDPALSVWFSELLGRDAQLVGAPAGSRRPTPGDGLMALADEGTVSLHSQASLDDLNARLAGVGQPALGPERFRANLVVDGLASGAEDEVARLQVGEVTLRFGLHDERCVVTTVDQDTGRRSGPEPLRTLATYRRSKGGGVRFGVYLAVEAPGRIRLGDPVVAGGPADGGS